MYLSMLRAIRLYELENRKLQSGIFSAQSLHSNWSEIEKVTFLREEKLGQFRSVKALSKPKLFPDVETKEEIVLILSHK